MGEMDVGKAAGLGEEGFEIEKKKKMKEKGKEKKAGWGRGASR